MPKGSEYRLPELPNAEEESMPLAGRPFVLCSRGCGEVYCSRECENADMDGSHWLLCTGPIDSAEHPLVSPLWAARRLPA